jgi:formylglycine-generating enzyme required for sulfatase activity/serine/threonine protein kinase
MAAALETVVKQLADSSIIAPGHLENFVPPKAHPTSVEELIAELVKNNHLTKFQAAQVAAGKTKSLILGEYTILDKIGAGGMGQVFKALHRRMERTVAIKVLPPTMTKDAAAVARFQREVVAAAKLSHPNIVHANDAGQSNGVHFLVMEYVEGKDLSALVKKNGPFSVAKAVNYVLQAARGLEFAHKKGVIHRDIKPANLLLDSEGTVKILDMGLARIESDGNAAHNAELTGTGAVMGTVDYMAPEQAVDTHRADARADIYSLGCSLHYLIAGRPTYEGNSLMGRMLAHREQPIPDLRTVQPEVSEQLQAIFTKMVAKKLEDRYQTMTEVIADLERISSNSATVSDPYAATSALSSGALAALKGIDVSRTTAKTAATKQVAAAKPAGGKQPPWKNIKLLIGAGFLGVLILAGIIVSLRTKDGTLIVEVDQPDATVQVLDSEGKVEVSQKGGVGKVTISVDPGKHRLRVEKDGFTVFGQEFEIESGDQKAIKATLAAVHALPALTADANRKVADWVLAKKGSLGIRIKGENKSKSVNQPTDVPRELFSVVSINLTRQAGLKTEAISDSELECLAASKEIENIQLYRQTNITDLGLNHLQSLKSLRTLNLNYCGVTDDGLRYLQALQNLKDLELTGTRTSDDGLVHLHRLDQLSKLKLRSTKITSAGIAALQKKLPNCKIEWDDTAKATTSTPPVGPTPPLAKAPFDAAQAKAHQAAWAKHLGTEVETTNSVGAKMILIPPGEFMMGSTDEQVEAALKVADELKADQPTKDRIQKSERPQHKVVITKPFLIGATEVTVGQFKKFSATGYQTTAEKAEVVAKTTTLDANQSPPKPILTYLNPGHAVTDDSPAAVITWNDAVAYCKWLSDQEKRIYRLPTEAEWEYACRAGTTTQYFFGDDYNESHNYGWHNNNAKGQSQPVGKLLPNSFGLFDMLGNLHEWCGDWYDEKWYENTSSNAPVGPVVGSSRVLRGGNWFHGVFRSRSASRGAYSPGHRLDFFCGFRCVSELNLSPPTASVTPQPTSSSRLFIHDPAFPQWMKDVQAMSAEQQIEAVSKKLMDFNPGFDGKLRDFDHKEPPLIQDGIVISLGIITKEVVDLSPVRALSGLKSLQCGSGSNQFGKLNNLSPLRGLQLSIFACNMTQVADLSPLSEMKLTHLYCDGTQVSDLSPLTGMPLKTASANRTHISDLSPMSHCSSLGKLMLTGCDKVSPAGVAALQKALPNCKIEWNDPAKATTPQPSASGTK